MFADATHSFVTDCIELCFIYFSQPFLAKVTYILAECILANFTISFKC